MIQERFRQIYKELKQKKRELERELQDQALYLQDLNIEAKAEEKKVISVDRFDISRIAIIKKNNLEQIDHALCRIDEGKYGLCLECNFEICIKRLNARPTATMCVQCQNLIEDGKMTG